MKLVNSQAFIAVLLSVLAHASIAVLGDYQFAKSGDRVAGSLSVKVASDSTDSGVELSSKSQAEQTPDLTSEPIAESDISVTDDSVAEKMVVPVSEEVVAVHEKSAQTSITEPVSRTTSEHVATVDSTVQNDNADSAVSSGNSSRTGLATIPAASELISTNSSSAAAQPKSESSQYDTPVPDVVSDSRAGSSSTTMNEGLVTTSMPIVSAIPLYHLIPKPHYPERSRDLGEEGTVIVAIKVADDGSVAKAYVSKSSGHVLLDGSALSSVRSKWRFRPATQAGEPVSSWVRVPIMFDIKSH